MWRWLGSLFPWVAATFLVVTCNGCVGLHSCKAVGTISLRLSQEVPVDKAYDVMVELGSRKVSFQCPSRLLSNPDPSQIIPGVGRVACLGEALTLTVDDVDIRTTSRVVVTVKTSDGVVYADQVQVDLSPATESNPDDHQGVCNRYGDLELAPSSP